MKKKNSVGVSNMAYVESEAANGKKSSTVRTVRPLQIVEDEPQAESESNCGYFGLRCPGQRHCLSAVGVLVFLCWASTIQVRIGQITSYREVRAKEMKALARSRARSCQQVNPLNYTLLWNWPITEHKKCCGTPLG